MSSTRSIVVVGGGPAGVAAAIEAKRKDPTARVTLITDEACEPYEKPPLSKAVLLGKARPEHAPIAGRDGIASHGVTVKPGARCTAIDRAARAVVLEAGERLAYDALVLATGSLLRELPLLPPGRRGAHYLRTHEQALALQAELARGRRLVVIGAGLIGLEVAASAAELGIKTTVLEIAPRILARVCDAETGAFIFEEHRRHGVDIRVGTALARTEQRGDGGFVLTTQAGETFMADLIVVGTGVKPDDALAAAAGLAVEDGIVVDAQCRTSDPNIFAAGDAVRFPGPGGGLVRLENWRHAQEQGAVAGRNASAGPGGTDSYGALPSFWSEQYDLYIQGAGWPSPQPQLLVRRPLPGKCALLFELAGPHVTYALGINAQRDLAAVRRLIERRIPVDPAELADPARPLNAMLKAKA